MSEQGVVEAVALSPVHAFSKQLAGTIRLVAGHGVEGDAHFGTTVKHRSRVARDPTQPNLRQVHLIHAELFDELREKGFSVKAGEVGENVTTRGIDLLGLPTGTRLHIGGEVIVEVTGLRNPCRQLHDFQAGLTEAVLDRDGDGNLVRKSGVMGIVVSGGSISAGDGITVERPREEARPLEPV